jgi:hypothetical protein
MSTTFTFNGRLAVTLQIGGQDVTVVGTADLTAAASMTLEYRAPSFDQAFNLGTFEEAVGKVVKAMQNVSLGGTRIDTGPSGNLTAKVNELKTAAKGLPGFQAILGDAARGIDAAQVRLTELRLDLEAMEPAAGASINDLRGSAAVGLALDLRTAPLTLPGVGIQVKTITVYVRLGINR